MQIKQKSHSRTWRFGGYALAIVICMGINTYILHNAQREADKQADFLHAKTKQDEAVLQSLVEAHELKAKQDAMRKEAAQASIQDKKDTDTAKKTVSKCNFSTTHSDPSKPDVLVNKKHCIIPLSYAPSDIVTVDGIAMSQKIVASYQELKAAAVRDGYSLRVTSGYRSYDTQLATYRYWVSVEGSAKKADTYSARPGYSEHQTGFALDFALGQCVLSCFNTSPASTWLKDNAYRYGFILRYPQDEEAVTGYSHESWHYRYVGKELAQKIHSSQKTTLEAYYNVEGGSY